MKTFYLVLKILAAVAAVAGLVFVIVKYGDKIVAWAKGLIGRFSRKNSCEMCNDECFEDEMGDLDDEIVAGDNDFEG